MKLHEFQGKELLKAHGIPVPESMVAHFPDEAWMHSMVIGFPCMLKSQVLSGGRGKAGGVRRCEDAEGVWKTAKEMFARTLVTKQSASEGLIVRKLLVEECLSIRRELYFSILLDTQSNSPLLIASPSGGADIEEIAAEQPESIVRIPVNPYTGLIPFHIRELLLFLGLDYKDHRYHDFFRRVYDLFVSTESLLLEINPLVVDGSGKLVPADVKIDIDDNALFRHPEILRWRDLTEYDPLEVEARLSGLNFIKLNGTIGCMVNGAGLAMATMDCIKMAGAEPANFLDVGGVATPETISQGFRILLKDKQIEAIFVNIFGGIVRCDKVARGIVDAVQGLRPQIPIIIRLTGSNMEEAMEILEGSSMAFRLARDVAEASEWIQSIADGKPGKEQ
jgi:succinyl-CoA synthetase beta subunit